MLKTNFSIPDLLGFLNSELQLTGQLAFLHDKKGIHGSLRPAHLKMSAAGLVINPPQPDDHLLSLLRLRYTSPEQAGRLALLDQRSDLYSLGIIFYGWLVGEVPFASDDLLDLAHQQMSLLPVAPALHLPQLPRQISDLILKRLAKSPDARYATARGLAADLTLCIRQLETRGEVLLVPPGDSDLVPDLTGMSVLLVEDNLVNQQIAYELMMAAFVCVDIANNGQEALQKLARLGR